MDGDSNSKLVGLVLEKHLAGSGHRRLQGRVECSTDPTGFLRLPKHDLPVHLFCAKKFHGRPMTESQLASYLRRRTTAEQTLWRHFLNREAVFRSAASSPTRTGHAATGPSSWRYVP
jgi:hypothetical protein